MRIEIPKQVEWILEKLKSHGYEAFAVGGCVRDVLLCKEPEDWDITTSAKPEQVKAVFGRTIDTGLVHGTVTVLRDGTGYEITTYRIDGEYEDGRHPKEVAFTSELKEDLRRRDFTINAMAYSHETGLVDIFGGISDLEKGIIRCVGDATERFTEDALRILRAIRFSAQLGFSIEEDTYRALSVIAPNLAHVSKERIQVELNKTLLSKHPERIILTRETGMLSYISPSFPEVFHCWEKKYVTDADKKLQSAAAMRKDKAMRYAAFLYPVGEVTAAKILKELKMDNDTTSRVKTLTAWAEKPLLGEDVFIRTVMSSMPDFLFDDLLELKEIMFPEEMEQIEATARTGAQIRARKDCIRLKDMAVNGRDLLDAGVKQGQVIGEMLSCLFSAVLEHPEFNNREYLLTLAMKECNIDK